MIRAGMGCKRHLATLDSNPRMRLSLGMSPTPPDLHAAYALTSPEDNKRLYADWARDYDDSFAAHEDYQLHIHAARAFVRAGGQGPVLDVGAGTGLCGAVLSRLGVGPIDATDISSEMLDQAMRKDIYRDAVEADLTQGLPFRSNSYAGIVSSGTFTHGHLGPDVLPALLRIARPGALFTLSINAVHYQDLGFDRALNTLTQDQIRNLSLPPVRIYGDLATGPNKDDEALIAVFEKV